MIWIWPVGLIKFQPKIVGKQKMLVLSSMGQNRIPVEHQHWWGDLNKQANKTHRDQLPIYHSQIFTSLLLFSLILPFFLGSLEGEKWVQREPLSQLPHMNAALSNWSLLLQRAMLSGGSRQLRQCQLPTRGTSSGSLTWKWESEPDLSTVLISHKTSWNYWRLSTSLLQSKIPSTTGLGHFHPSHRQSKN